MFEILEHTADIGFRVQGRTLAELFEGAAQALVSIAVEIEDITPRQAYPLTAEGEDYESLLVNWLSEVLYWLDGKRVAMRRFQVSELSPCRVSGQGIGEPRQAARPGAKLIVKGVTYHQLKVVEEPEGWWAQVFLDI
jgi:SHS2 domain-containing protein